MLAPLSSIEPKLQLAQQRLEELTRIPSTIFALIRNNEVRQQWPHLTLTDQRAIIEAVMVPRVHRVDPSKRGRKGPDPSRVDPGWL